MTKKPIVTQLSENRNILRQVAVPVAEFDQDLWDLLDDLRETLDNYPGKGLSAPQIGASRRVFILNDYKCSEVVNPILVSEKGEETLTEGCLSIPGLEVQVTRASKIVIDAQDRFGNPMRINARGPIARVILHEMDHLDGILIIDRAVKG